jgi:hypothetical protein
MKNILASEISVRRGYSGKNKHLQKFPLDVPKVFTEISISLGHAFGFLRNIQEGVC